MVVEPGQALAAYGDGMNEWQRQVFIAETGIDPVAEGEEAVSKDKELTLFDFRKWLGSLSGLELIEAEAEVTKARERKRDEGRVTLLRVAADGINVGYFPSDDMVGALSYLLTHEKEGLGEVRIERVRIRESEVEEHLANRWWPL